MRPSSISNVLKYWIKQQRPVFIWGPPGIGKSEVVAQTAVALNYELQDVRLNLLDPVDIRGLPVPNHEHKQMIWYTPDFLPSMLIDGKPNMTEGILFLDDFNSADRSVQAAGYQLILNRRIGKYILPVNWTIVAAGNRDSDRAITYAMPSALSSRFVHLDFDVHLDDFCKHAIKNNIQPELIAFLRFRTNLLHNFEPKLNARAFPCPRTWVFVNQLIGSKLAPEEEFEAMAGIVGEGAAGEFSAFLRLNKDLPTIDQILLDPDQTPIPKTDQPSTIYAITSTLSHYASKENFDRIMRYANRLPVEFQVLFVRDSSHKCEAITKTTAFIEWGIKNYALLT